MKKLFCLIAILVFAASTVSPVFASAAPQAGSPAYDDPQPQAPGAQPGTQNAGLTLYMPIALVPVPFFDISGQIKDSNDTPLPGVTVTADTGATAVTDANGIYKLEAPQGERVVTATYAGKSFDPEPAWLNLAQDTNNLNFSAGAACVNRIANPSFEIVNWYGQAIYWNPISGGANGYVPFPTQSRAYTGLRSGFAGIPPTGYLNLESASRWRTQPIYIPLDASTLTVSMFYWPRTTEAAVARDSDQTTAPDLSGYNTDSPQHPAAGDWQYVFVTDINNNWLATLWQNRSNTQTWTNLSGELLLAAFRGRTIKLEFGVYNDGLGGVTSAFFDDVTMTVCRSPIYTTCTAPVNYLLNSNFELPSYGWTISPAVRPSVPDISGNFFYSPITSMQSGMPLGTVPPAATWTTSEFYQYVTVPMTATRVTLTARLLPRSTDGWGYNLLGQQQLDQQLQSAQARGASPLMPDAWESQYGYICAYPQCGPSNPSTLAQLFRWFPIDSSYWLYREWDLTRWRGTTFGILFGAQDFGDFGNTVLYVDDVQLMVCP